MKFSILKLLEIAFERLGRFIAKWPYIVIILCLLCTGLCSIGFLNITFNTNTYEIWDTNPNEDPNGSQSVVHKNWVSRHFGDTLHSHTLIFSATDPDGNILTPNALNVMLQVHKTIAQPMQNVSFKNICQR